MAHVQQAQFCKRVKEKYESFFENKYVLDIGSLDINGNNQKYFENCNYVGVDIEAGRNVDIISKGHELGVPDGTFDVIISTECFEHDKFYDKTIKNIYRMLKPGGLFFFTCATTGRPEHGTRKTTPKDAPFLQNDSEWSDYYKNLKESDIRDVINIDDSFEDYEFSINDEAKDLYFYGIKIGEYQTRDDYSFLLKTPYYAQLFFEEGGAYSEDNSIKYPILGDVSPQKVVFKFQIKEGIQNLRFDPCNDVVILKMVVIETESDIDLLSSNAFYVENNIYCFDTIDPQIFFKIKSNKESVFRVEVEYIQIGEEAKNQFPMVLWFCEKLQALQSENALNINHKKKISALSSEITSKDKEIKSFRAEITSKNKEIKSFRAEITSKNKEIKSFRAEITSKNKEIESSRAEITSKDKDALYWQRLAQELRLKNRLKRVVVKIFPGSKKAYIFSQKQAMNLNLRQFKQVLALVRTIGVKKTIIKIQHTLDARKGSAVFDLIALKPVEKKWQKKDKLKHEYDISVIIPTYNRAQMLEGLIESWKEVSKVTKYTYEIIFSDDGSNDKSIEILQNVDGLPIKILQNNHGGASKARNAAIMVAKGRKLLIIGDDIFPNKFILNQHYEKLNEVGITCAVLGECVWHSSLKVNHLMDHITEIGCEQFSYKHFPKNGYTDFRHFYTCNISIDREFLLSEKNIFDERFYKVNFEDIELGYRLAKKGMQIYYLPEAKGEHLHPYVDVNKFCLRQEVAGEMSLVFNELHKEMDVILDKEVILSKWRLTQENKILSRGFSLYDEIISFCQYVEDNHQTSKSGLSSHLSEIYSLLFRFAYEKGICQELIDVDTPLLNQVFTKYFFTDRLRHAISSLNEECNVPNVEAILRSEGRKDALLIIEVKDQEHLNLIINKYSQLNTYLRFKIKSEMEVDGHIYRPSKGFELSENSLRQVLLFLQKYSTIDVILLSFDLCDLPYIGIHNTIQNSLITRVRNEKVDEINLSPNHKGKVIRVFETSATDRVALRTFGNTFDYLDEYGFFSSKRFDEKSISIELNQFNLNLLSDKPCVFVFPIFLAVGGAEKNTLEIINNLQDKYDFVIINFERLNQGLGSLHKQFRESCKAIYDLTELSTHNDILDYLTSLEEFYKPKLVWICNGSPWLAANTVQVRNIFNKTAIVDQQVYDAQEGWINIFDDLGIHTFDRFIAINTKIEKVFIKDKGLDKSKVDMIHHVVKSEKFSKSLYTKQRALLARKYNVSLEKKNFIFVGRMAEQKRPLLFLNIVKKVQERHPSYNFIMVGDGPLSSSVDEFITKNKLHSIQRIKFIEEIPELYSLVDGLIITSKFEGLPIAMLEAMCMGIPVFATDVGDIDIVIDQYCSGVTVPVGMSVDDIVKVFFDFDRKLIKYQKYALDSVEEIRGRFSEATVSLNYDRCFQKAIKGKK